MSRTLPHEQKFASAETIDSWWNNSGTIGLVEVGGKQYVQATGTGTFPQGLLGFSLTSLQETYSPTKSDVYTIKIVSGPNGFAQLSNVSFYMEFILQSLSDNALTNTIRISALPTGFHIECDTDGDNFNLAVDATIPGSAILISVMSNYPTDTTTVVISFYNDDGLSTMIQQASHTFDYGDTWSSSYPYMEVGKEDDFMVAELGVYLSPSCIAQGSLIETTEGLKTIETLTDKDVLYDTDGTPTPIVKVWKTKVPLGKNCVQLGKVFVSENHMIRADKFWHPAKSLGVPRPLQAYFYQIQTDSYGFRCDDYSIATWTKLYLETADTRGYE